MKRLLLWIFLVLIVLNFIAGLIFPAYKLSWPITFVVILFNGFALNNLLSSKVADGFKIGISFVLGLLFIVQLIVGGIVGSVILNNPLVFVIVGLFAVEIILLVIGRTFSKFQ